MEIDFSFICDFAEASGKLNALGIGFDTIFAKQLPFKHPHFSLALQLRASLSEAGQKKIQVNLIDDDGKDVIPPIQGQFGIPETQGTAPNIGRFVMEFGNVEFKKYGTYSIRIIIENKEMASIVFRVSQPTSQSTASKTDVNPTI